MMRRTVEQGHYRVISCQSVHSGAYAEWRRSIGESNQRSIQVDIIRNVHPISGPHFVDNVRVVRTWRATST